MIRRLIITFPLVLLALLVLAAPFWLNPSLRTPSPSQEGGLGRMPDYVAENFSSVEMDSDGIARHMLLAKRMVHYPDDDTTDLEQPYFIETEPGKPAVQITSDHAKLSSNNENIYLTGNVMLLRNAGKGRAETSLTTSLLHLVPKDDIAKTDKPVVITEPYAVIRAVGMEMNNRSNVTQLLSQVKVLHNKKR
ncbi:LPS export ABC transporter periplasmic protein LptC [Nitrosovibrio tenuis]|uniref:Lipopolysaccharide export system protein LptC n=1 Tax=Nitrosovibrio tenuis TaxID=1233 RepID=A0A1H7P297_9PROT|nr:LPS export ABC transporter periplasmic protein LptC [Nitrosovibrio tenuis]SEL29932.1 lipopolysaccharide export system protein LptC [Nitrosovibrio tenuis]